jgi:hypothetical protein
MANGMKREMPSGFRSVVAEIDAIVQSNPNENSQMQIITTSARPTRERLRSRSPGDPLSLGPTRSEVRHPEVRRSHRQAPPLRADGVPP